MVQAPPPPPPESSSRLAALSSDNGLIAHFVNPKPMPPMPWELPLEARQRRSKDPRVAKHIADIDRWNDTPLSEVWARIRSFAAAKNDWIMSRYDVVDWLKSEGVTSELMIDRLIDVFEAKEAGTVQAYNESISNGVAALTRNCPAASFGFAGDKGGANMLSGMGILPSVFSPSSASPSSPSAGGGRPRQNTASTAEGGFASRGRPSGIVPQPPTSAGGWLREYQRRSALPSRRQTPHLPREGAFSEASSATL